MVTEVELKSNKIGFVKLESEMVLDWGVKELKIKNWTWVEMGFGLDISKWLCCE